MILHCKKAKLFITGEVFPLDIGLLMCEELTVLLMVSDLLHIDSSK